MKGWYLSEMIYKSERVLVARVTLGMVWTCLILGVFLVRGGWTGNAYSVRELSQEFSSPPWETNYPRPGGQFQETYVMYYLPHGQPMQDGREPLASIFGYRPGLAGKDHNEYPHILPGGGKTIEQLQHESDLRLKKIFIDYRENERSLGEEVRKLKNGYGYGTIGYPGYKDTIKYGPIDLGTHKAIDLGFTLQGSRLPVQTVTVTKTLQVRVPQPFPVRQEVPVPAPFPVPAPSHLGAGSGREYPDGFAGKLTGKGFDYPELKLENRAGTDSATTSVNQIPPTAAGYYLYRKGIPTA